METNKLLLKSFKKSECVEFLYSQLEKYKNLYSLIEWERREYSDNFGFAKIKCCSNKTKKGRRIDYFIEPTNGYQFGNLTFSIIYGNNNIEIVIKDRIRDTSYDRHHITKVNQILYKKNQSYTISSKTYFKYDTEEEVILDTNTITFNSNNCLVNYIEEHNSSIPKKKKSLSIINKKIKNIKKGK